MRIERWIRANPFVSAVAVIVLLTIAIIAYLVRTEIALPCSVAAASGGPVPNHILEQYKAYVADLGIVGSQFATTQTFFVTVVSALVAVVAVKEQPRSIEGFFAAVPIVVFGFIALVCASWWFTTLTFSNLIAAKFLVLRCMEKNYFALYPMFDEQTQHYLNHRTYGIIRHQAWPIIVIGVVAALIAAAGIDRLFRIRGGSERKTPGSEPALVSERWSDP